ncbi:hypothetical protein [Polyangium jinanense]|uniref:EF-hand domain-containing protein n=1 Tax=Polyangium jinanense TaxID=2829994 RepID=A0A9X4ARL1_9BACT|nr:hypothetical protein [Polyangium jinanense]MDC3982189.1 hypothetical protein [Polyangium jinanense]
MKTIALRTPLFLASLALLVAGCSNDPPQNTNPNPTCQGAECDAGPTCTPATGLAGLEEGLEGATRKEYAGGGDGGLAHITYWTLKAGTPEFDALSPEEQAKVKKVQSTVLHSQKLLPKDDIAGLEITGTLVVAGSDGERRQEIVLKVPTNWNGELVVAGTPGTRNEFASDGTIAPWILRRGYAYVSGNKGQTNGGADGNATLLSKTHPTRHWGAMMLDMASWASGRLEKVACKKPARIFAAGLSNGGYQVRRALEIDAARVKAGEARLFDGGVDWSGAYWPDARVLDTDGNGKVTPAEYAKANHLVSTNERAALVMRWAYDPATLTTPQAYLESPPFSAAHAEMTAAGFTPASAPIWGAYNTLFDALKAQVPSFKGIGYFNFTAYYYRAELFGHDLAASSAYSTFQPNAVDPPPFYTWIPQAPDGGWTEESVGYALANANTGEFSVPLISLHGDADALLGLDAHGVAYKAAVEKYGSPEMHRLYVIAYGGHVDLHSDGAIDFDFDGTPGEEGAADLFTPMQPYVERAFDALVAWVKDGTAPKPSGTVATDPKNDVLDAAMIDF